jgi:hypothetical protein
MFADRIFIVDMLRYGSRDHHLYQAGVYWTLEEATAAANSEMLNRGGKYDAEIIEKDVYSKKILSRKLITWEDRS